MHTTPHPALTVGLLAGVHQHHTSEERDVRLTDVRDPRPRGPVGPAQGTTEGVRPVEVVPKDADAVGEEGIK